MNVIPFKLTPEAGMRLAKKAFLQYLTDMPKLGNKSWIRYQEVVLPIQRCCDGLVFAKARLEAQREFGERELRACSRYFDSEVK